MGTKRETSFDGSDRTRGMDLEEFRIAKGLSYRQLGALIGANHASKVRSWAFGEARPDADQMEAIVIKTDGAVTIEAMHQRRLSWLRENNRCAALEDCEADGEATG